MIHHWECEICTNQWTSGCCGFFSSDKARDYHSRHLQSHLCAECFSKLLKGELGQELLAIFELLVKLDKKRKDFGHLVGISGGVTSSAEMVMERKPEKEEKDQKAFEDLKKWRRESFSLETYGNRFFQRTEYVKNENN